MQEKYLNKIKSPDDVKALQNSELKELCKELRTEIIDTVSKNGGHLASNLGSVELSVALHRNFNLPQDKIVFDVGHQCYAHKMLTGRFERFSTLRQKGGISGFPRPNESEYDSFSTGHSSTSISAGFGICEAMKIRNDNGYVVAVIGDGSFSGGLVYEAMNNAGRTKDNLIVILNDNKMSISKNVGAMSKHLAVIRSTTSYHRFKVGTDKVLRHIPFVGNRLRHIVLKVKRNIKGLFFKSTIFEDMGFSYIGPIDGHDLDKLDYMLKLSKTERRPVLLHINTTKGKGYSFAEKNPDAFHGVSGFNVETGEIKKGGNSFSDEFGSALVDFAKNDKRICAITAAMCESTGLNDFRNTFKYRFFDVGIAEQHAVTFASGMSSSGMIPVFAVYSTFLQRSYDQIVHDAALQNLKVILGIDRAGIVGADGETHQGLFDVAFLNAIPNVTIYSPATFRELHHDMKCAIYNDEGVVAIRYPRGNEISVKMPNDDVNDYCVFGDDNAKISVVVYGREFEQVYLASKRLKEKNIDLKIIKLNKIKPIPKGAIEQILDSTSLYFFEEGMLSGGFSEHFLSLAVQGGYKGSSSITAIESFVVHQSVSQALKEYKLDEQSIYEKIKGDN